MTIPRPKHGHHAEHVARQHVDRRAHGEMDLGSALDEIQRLLARRVAEADDQDRPALPRITVAELARVQDVAAELPPSPATSGAPRRGLVRWPPRRCRSAKPLCPSSFPTCRPPAPRGARASPKCGFEGEMLLVALEVLDHLIAGGIAAASSSASEPRQRRRSASGCAGAGGRTDGARLPATTSSASMISNSEPRLRSSAAVARPAAEAPITRVSVVVPIAQNYSTSSRISRLTSLPLAVRGSGWSTMCQRVGTL